MSRRDGQSTRNVLQVHPMGECYSIRLIDGSGNISMQGTGQYAERLTAFRVAEAISSSLLRSRVELVDLNGDVLDGVPIAPGAEK